MGRGIVVNARAAASEASLAFDAAGERLAKELRRYKRRLRDHHAKGREPAGASERAMDYVLAPIEEEEAEGEEAEGEEAETGGVNGAPAVIAEMSTELPSLTVGEAAMRMDLAEVPVLLFRNRSHGELNLVYRRSDGNIGWIDPELRAARPTRRTAGQHRNRHGGRDSDRQAARAHEAIWDLRPTRAADPVRSNRRPAGRPDFSAARPGRRRRRSSKGAGAGISIIARPYRLREAARNRQCRPAFRPSHRRSHASL